ncbi:DUF2292 domain-containing protein [Trichococcus sp.]|jgi:hypothetical protein|uniref:DUF2292 domain-containing protein n=1 Tax=Trichococcus sp. TaxID=1985464 RepID=UPI003C7E4BF7
MEVPSNKNLNPSIANFGINDGVVIIKDGEPTVLKIPDFGQVLIKIQDKKIVNIDKTEKYKI